MKPSNIKKQLILIATLSLLLPSISTAGSLSFGNFISFFGYETSFGIPPSFNEDNSVDMAKKAVKQYMQERSEGTYKIGKIEDRGTHYLAEVSGSSDKVKEILVIDKKTYKIQPLK